MISARNTSEPIIGREGGHGPTLGDTFAYAEAGHLTWGYATTLHKAQGAALDQVFLLADDTLQRERSYSGLSRGTEANNLYLAVPDVDEHHGVEDVDDLIELLRETVKRSEAKTFALEDLLSRRPWTARHGHEASRLGEIDSLIAKHRREHQARLGRDRGMARSVEPDIGLDLGL